MLLIIYMMLEYQKHGEQNHGNLPLLVFGILNYWTEINNFLLGCTLTDLPNSG